MSFLSIQNLSQANIASTSQNYSSYKFTFRLCSIHIYSKVKFNYSRRVFKGFYRGGTSTCSARRKWIYSKIIYITNIIACILSIYSIKHVQYVYMYFAVQPKLSIKSIKRFANTMRGRFDGWNMLVCIQLLLDLSIQLLHEKDRILQNYFIISGKCV